MTLQNFGNVTLSKRLPSPTDIAAYELINLTSFVLASEDGCSLQFSGYPAGHDSGSLFKTGGGWWSTSPNFSYPTLWNPGNGTVDDLDAEHPIMLNTSSECGDRSMFIFATSYQEGENFQAQGQICKSTYFSAELPVTVTNDGSTSSFAFDEIQFNISRASVPSSALDIQTFEKAFLSDAWSSKFQPPDPSSNSTPPIRPRLGGPLVLLGAQSGFDVTKMMSDSNLVDQARQIKQRFLGESLLAAFQQLGDQRRESVNGQVSTNEQKIVVSLPAGIILVATLLLSSLMIGLVTGYTRLHERPLNLLQDPSSSKAVASLISSGQNTRPLFEGLDTSSEVSMRKQLSRHVFHLRHGIIYSYDVRDTYQQSGNSSSGRSIETKWLWEHIANIITVNVEDEPNDNIKSKNWRPKVLRGWVLALLSISLAAFLVALGISFSVFHDTGIFHTPFKSNPDVSNDNSALIALAPYSVIPTLLAVCVKLWRGSIDDTFRRLQPYISMAQGPVPVSRGSNLSYINSPVLWIVGKAISNKHFLLALVTIGTLLSEVRTCFDPMGTYCGLLMKSSHCIYVCPVGSLAGMEYA
jgi:hypothetical protein